MADQEPAVNQEAEQTAQTDSAPDQNQTVQENPAQTGESAGGSQRTTQTVPYERFKEVNDRVKQLEEVVNQHLPSNRPAQPAPAVFDPETQAGINQMVEQRYRALRDNERALEFAQRHAKDLEDPLLKGAVMVEIQDANTRGEYIDQEAALIRAKAALEARLSAKADQAGKDASDEQSRLTQAKARAGAVGGTGTRKDPVDPESLTASEYAEYYGLKTA